MTTRERYQDGVYPDCSGVEGSEQYGMSSSGNEQIAVQVVVPGLNATLVTFLSFSERAALYSIERLRAMGWEGNDLSDLRGIGRLKVPVKIFYETYQGEERLRAEIVTGVRFEMARPLDQKARRAFGARFMQLAASTRVAGAGAASFDAPRPAEPRKAAKF